MTIKIIERTALRTLLSWMFIVFVTLGCVAVFLESYLKQEFQISSDYVTLLFVGIAFVCGFIMTLTKGHKVIGELRIDKTDLYFDFNDGEYFEDNINRVRFNILTSQISHFPWWAWFRALIPQLAGKKNYVQLERNGSTIRYELLVSNDRAHEFLGDVGRE